MSVTEIYFHNFKTVKARVMGISDTLKGVESTIIEISNDKGQSIALQVFGPQGKINALANCLNTEFNPKPELPDVEESPADSYDYAADDFNFDSARERSSSRGGR